MADHGARDHATWAASATARNWHCSGALALARFAPPQSESIHSARGTACHQIAEKCLRTGVDAMSFLDTVEQAKSISVTIDEELANTAQAYVDYVRDSAAAGEAQPMIEQKFDLAKLNPPFDAGGTGDAVLYYRHVGMLEVVDLKAGMGVVDAKDNPQLRTYALGAMLANPGLDVTHIKVTIIQPRAPHRNGPSETFHVADLVEWTADLVAAMKRSKAAMDAFDAADGNAVVLEEWAAEWLKPGKCTFCPVEGSCPALKRDALSVAKVWFDDMDQPRLGNEALDTSPEALGRDLDMIPMLEDWIKARRALAHSMAEAGTDIPGYQLSDKIGNRKWGDVAGLLTAMEEADLSLDEIHDEPKLKSPAQLEKVLGAKRKALIEPFVVREVTGTNLVSVAKTSRPTAKTVAGKYFEN